MSIFRQSSLQQDIDAKISGTDKNYVRLCRENTRHGEDENMIMNRPRKEEFKLWNYYCYLVLRAVKLEICW